MESAEANRPSEGSYQRVLSHRDALYFVSETTVPAESVTMLVEPRWSARM